MDLLTIDSYHTLLALVGDEYYISSKTTGCEVSVYISTDKMNAIIGR